MPKCKTRTNDTLREEPFTNGCAAAPAISDYWRECFYFYMFYYIVSRSALPHITRWANINLINKVGHWNDLRMVNYYVRTKTCNIRRDCGRFSSVGGDILWGGQTLQQIFKLSGQTLSSQTELNSENALLNNLKHHSQRITLQSHAFYKAHLWFVCRETGKLLLLDYALFSVYEFFPLYIYLLRQRVFTFNVFKFKYWFEKMGFLLSKFTLKKAYTPNTFLSFLFWI